MKSYLKIFNLTVFNLIIFNLINLQSTHAHMFWNQTCKFAGNAASYVSVRNSSSINLTGSFTIETWSHPFTFVNDEATYSFVDSAGAAFGSNQIQVDTSPIRFAIYGGDVNQDGVVDASDAGAIDNDAFNFITGYVQTDITGDEVVDASDASIADITRLIL